MPALRTLLLLMLLCWATAISAAEPQQLDKAEFTLSDSELPPGDDAGWYPQALPDPWPINHSQAQAQGRVTGWYRFTFHLEPKEKALQAVYLPKLGLNAAVYVNDAFIGDGGGFSEPFGRNWNRPLLFIIPPEVVHPGKNTLHIRLLSHSYTQATLHPPQIGQEVILRQAFEGTLFQRVTLNQTASLLILSIGVLMLTLWWRRRQDVAYGYFGLSALVWSAQSTNLYLRQVPLDTATWEILINSSFQVFSALLLISLLRFSAAGGKPLLPVLWFSMVAAPLSQWLVPERYFLGVTAFWHIFTLACAGITLLLLLRAGIRWRNRDAALMAGAMGLVVVLAGHDWLMHSQHLWLKAPHEYPQDFYLLHYSAPLIFLAVGLIMVGRFVKVLNEFEGLNNELEERVQSKHVELQDSYARMRALETEQAVTEERERIYRDLHDDVGAKLLSLVYRADKPENADLARSALQDLRDVVSTTQQDNLTLGMACADWRAECEQRLTEAGITLNWSQSGPMETLPLSPPQALNLGRILREAVSNLIKHAGASLAQVELVLDANRTLSLRIRDNGVGQTAARPGHGGRGVRNMAARAERIGAAFSLIMPTEGGCIVSVVLSLAG